MILTSDGFTPTYLKLQVAFGCALHMFACMAQLLKFPILACVVYARFQEMFDEMKTSMHRIARYSLIFYKWHQNLASNIDLMRYVACLCFSSDIQQTMVLRMVFKWQLRLVSRFDGPFFTPQHHLVAITLPNFLIHAYVQAFKSKLLAHMQGELILPTWVYETCP